jgi:predicted DNA repair protein MutK
VEINSEIMGSEDESRHSPFRFDNTITLGHILNVVALVVTISVFGYNIIHRMDDMGLKVDLMWQQFQVEIKGR